MRTCFPTYPPGGSTTTLGGVTEPNVAVYPSAAARPRIRAAWPGRRDRSTATARAAARTRDAAPRGSQPARPAVLALLLPRRRPQRRRLADRLLRLATRRTPTRRSPSRDQPTTARRGHRGRGARAEPRLLPDGGHQRRRQGHPFVMSPARRGHRPLHAPARGRRQHRRRPAGPSGQSVGDNPLAAVPASRAGRRGSEHACDGHRRVPTSGGTAIPVSTLGTPNYAATRSSLDLRGPQRAVALELDHHLREHVPRRRDELTGCTVAGEARSASTPATTSSR